jgi:NADH-quinone oxidoreductase subunit N
MAAFLLMLPEVFLALTLAFIIAGEITYYGEQVRLITATALLGVAAALVQTVISYKLGSSEILGGAMVVDGMALFFKLLFILAAGFAVSSASHSREIPVERRTEYNALIIAATLAMCLAASSADLVLTFLSLLFLNTASYFLSSFGKQSIFSTEAAVKALVFGSVGSALLLYSFALLFAYTHSFNIHEIHKALIEHPIPPKVLLVTFSLGFLSLCTLLGAFPMNFFVPDVLEGSPTPVSGFLAIGMRATGLVVMLRFLLMVFAKPSATLGLREIIGEVDWTQWVAAVSAISMGVGSLLAFRQTSAKRLIAYLLVSEAGFLLLGLLVLDGAGVQAILYSLVADLFAMMGSYYILSMIYDRVGSDHFRDLRKYLRNPVSGISVPECICLVVFLLSLAGSPPTPGFIGKFGLIGVTIRHQRPLLALFAVGSLVISTAAVARLFFPIFSPLGETGAGGQAVSTAEAPQGMGRRAVLFALILPLLGLSLFSDFVFHIASESLRSIFW